MPSFNLVDQPWIPCVSQSGDISREYSLRDVLTEAHHLREIHDNSPLATVAIHRLLLAILYRCLPAWTEEEWTELWEALWRDGYLPAEAIDAYLTKWYDRFDLFSETHPFYQTAGLEIVSSNKKNDTLSPITRLVPEFASSSNATLFDHHFDENDMSFLPAEAVRMLLVAQIFSLGGGQTGTARIGDTNFKRPNAEHGLLINGMVAWLTGESIFHTLMLNLVPDSFTPDDRPPWEQDAPISGLDAIQRMSTNAVKGRIDLLTWQSRMIRLCPNVDQVPTVNKVYYTQGRSVGDIKGFFDPMKSYVRDEKGFQPQRLGHEQAAWCDYHALLSLDSRVSKRPDAFGHVAQESDIVTIRDENRYQLHAVGIVNDQAKVILWRYDRMSIKPVLLNDVRYTELLAELKRHVVQTGIRLRWRALQLCYYYTAPNCKNIDEAKRKQLYSPKPKASDVIETQHLASSIDPCYIFWSRLETHFYRLLDDLPQDTDGAAERWRKTITNEAERVFKEACTTLGTSARALRAIARVSPYFNPHERRQ